MTTTACANHTRDSFGWPLGNCPACLAYRQRMDVWYWDQVLSGNSRPELTTAVEQIENGEGL